MFETIRKNSSDTVTGLEKSLLKKNEIISFSLLYKKPLLSKDLTAIQHIITERSLFFHVMKGLEPKAVPDGC